nr:RnfABCDGE type electron transport complex subunit D [bacterium]
MIRPLINLLKAEGIHNAKLLAAMPLIFSSFIFFQNQILIVYFSSVITSYVIHIIFELLTGNKDFYKQIDLTFLYLALIFPMTIVSNITIAGVITGSFIFSAAYVLLKKSGVRIFNPIILGWGYIFFIYRHYYQLPLPSEIVKTYSEFSPDLITAATPSALYFINGNSVSWERIFLGLSIGAPCELFLTAILIGLFLQIGAKAISYRILVSAVAAYMIPSAIYFFIKSGFVFNRVLFTNIVNFLILGPFLFLITFVLDDCFSVP